jgi:predicted DNA-binding antitoxin AbrB/MazE fold protein
MSEKIDAIYDGGVLKPLVPLLLPDKVRVTLTIEAAQTSRGTTNGTFKPRDDWERQLLNMALDCGVSLPDSILSSDQLYE